MLSNAVTALYDGRFDMGTGLFPDIAKEPLVAKELLGLRAVPNTIDVPVWAFLLRHADHVALVDAGGGALMGPGFGGVRAALAAAGVTSAEIDRVFLSHLHGDHCGGLIGADFTAQYPNARLAIGRAEVAFWTGGQIATDLSAIAQDAQHVLAAYRDRIDLVQPGDRVDGALAIAAAGHTPGHIAWGFDALGAVAAGDIFHVPKIQIAKPHWHNQWDMDATAARESRIRIVSEAIRSAHSLLCGHGGMIGPHDLSAFNPNQ